MSTSQEARQGEVLPGLAIFLSAFLLFALEPLVAKRILPWFGGSASVWSTCLVFYQTALLLGYVYARISTRYVKPSVQGVFHILLLLCSLLFLPIGPGSYWKPDRVLEPSWLILGMLAATIGIPFVALSATTPLLQDWLARGGHQTPYRFFALSNAASLAALFAYPIFIEPNLDAAQQSFWWSAGYVSFVVACGSVAWLKRHERPLRLSGDEDETQAGLLDRIYWFALAACGSMLLLSVTNEITENIAPVPLLWILPLAVYLLSFVAGFGWKGFYQRSLWQRLLALALGLLGYTAYNIDTVQAIQVSLPISLGGLFICCTFCQGELYLRRPHVADLTGFYLLISFGGAAGAVFVGLIAPRVFGGIYEFPLTLTLTAALALALIWKDARWAPRLLWAGVTMCMTIVCAANIMAYRRNSLSLRRSFYGSLRVTQSPHAGPEQSRTLFHGTIQHGAQFLWPESRKRPTTYYGPDSGIGIVLRECFGEGKRVGVAGLGVGTLAAYGQTGDTFRFYEINHQVVEIAGSLFFFTRETPARVQIVEGDARLSLERDASPAFDVLVLDAFSGDAIPVHLITREAVALYLRHLRPNGVLAFHVSNNYLELASIVKRLGDEIGYRAIDVKSHGDADGLTAPAEWVLLTRNAAILDNEAIKMRAQPIPERSNLRTWTDDFNSLLPILKWPEIK